VTDFRFAVNVLPKPGILDPQGRAVEGSLGHLGVSGVSAVRVGRRVELTVRAADEAAARDLFEADSALMQDLHSLPQPVIARVHGPASAGGCHLVAACDLAIASTAATFAVPGPALGLVGTTAMVEVARVIGRQRAMRMLLTGAPISAHTALAWGLVNHVVPHEELLPAAERWARMILSNGQQAIRSAKETILEIIGRPLDEALRLETVNGYSSVGDFREVAERLGKFFGKE